MTTTLTSCASKCGVDLGIRGIRVRHDISYFLWPSFRELALQELFHLLDRGYVDFARL